MTVLARNLRSSRFPLTSQYNRLLVNSSSAYCARRQTSSPSSTCLINPTLISRSFSRQSTVDSYRHRHSHSHGHISDLSGIPIIGDTIYALSTAQGRAGIAVIRVSGPSCLDIYRALCPSKPLPKPRYATVRSLYEPSAGQELQILDSEALVLYFPSPKTVTGEDVLELHVHGGPATVKAVLSAIPRCSASASSSSSARQRIRYAEPGEFTKRAFFNNRLDLAQIESLSDTLAAETEQQRRAAVRGNSGALGRSYEAWREKLLLARGEIEALIDFSEDQHFDEPQSELLGSVTHQVAEILHSIRLHEQGSQRSELLRNGIRIALVGPPNAGKSSLMNLIVGREASIVSGEAGTTRDIVEASLDIRGYLCSFADTAGFRSRIKAPGTDETLMPGGGAVTAVDGGQIGAVEEEGIRRAKQKALESDVVVVLASVEQGPFQGKGTSTGSNGNDNHDNGIAFCIQYDDETLDLAAKAQACLIVVNKTDCIAPEDFATLANKFRETLRKNDPKLARAQLIPISCKEAQQQQQTTTTTITTTTTTGGSTSSFTAKDPGSIQAVISQLVECFTEMTCMPADLQDLLGVTERQRQLLVKCRGHLEEFMLEAQQSEENDGEDHGMVADTDTVLAAEYLRYAANCLARITGRGEFGDVEDVLGVIFEKFCVGK